MLEFVGEFVEEHEGAHGLASGGVVMGVELAADFEEDKRRSRRVTLEAWRARPWQEKAKDRLAATLRKQL